MAKTVVVEKDGVKKTVQEAYKNDFIAAGWKEVKATETYKTPNATSYSQNNAKY